MRKTNCIAKLLKNRRGERGAALVEMALIFPVLLLLGTGVTSFGFALNQYLEMTNAVTVGAEVLAVSRGNDSQPCTNAIDAVYNAAPFLAQADFTFTITFTTNAGVSTTYTPSTTGGSAQSQCDSAATESNSPIFIQGESVELGATYSPYSIQYYGGSLRGMKLATGVSEIIQ
jgi:Flp pilus assembly protein TadG